MAKKSITAIVAFVVSLAIAPLASAAALTDHSGTICKALYPSDLAVVDYSFSSIRSFKSTGTYVLCPLTRSTTNSLGALVYVDIRHYGTQTTYCSAWSTNPGGTQLAGTGQLWTGAGYHGFQISLAGLGKSDGFSNYSVVCSIPGNYGGEVIDVDLFEY